MSRPRHLWSGDWENDSAAVTEELGRRRGESEPPVEPRPDVPPAPSRRPALERLVLWLRGELSKARERRRERRRRARERARKRPARARSTETKRLRIVLLAVLVGLLSAGIAYGLTTLLVGSGSPKAHSASTARPWLGADLVSIPLSSGVLIADVVPGGPAESAGLQPGNMITAIDGKPVSTTDDVTAALDSLHVGNQVEIQYTLGLAIPGSYTTHVTLAAEPPGYP